jgi:uncharacterized membrane protein
MDNRMDAMINGALIVIGAAAIIDTIVFHWLLRWHRLIEGVPDPEMFLLELSIVLIGGILLSIGTWREYTARS